MKALIFYQIDHREKKFDSLRFWKPLDITHIPNISEEIWLNDKNHHCDGNVVVERIDHEFFHDEDIHVILIKCRNNIDSYSSDFYLDWPDANKEGREASPLWKSVGDEYWKTAHSVPICV